MITKILKYWPRMTEDNIYRVCKQGNVPLQSYYIPKKFKLKARNRNVTYTIADYVKATNETFCLFI